MTESQLLERASKLTGEIEWVREYGYRWRRMEGLARAQRQMCNENSKADERAVDMLENMIELAKTKADKCDAWLRENEPRLARLMVEVNPQ